MSDDTPTPEENEALSKAYDIYDAFMTKHAARFEEWMKRHPDTPPPIFVAEDGSLHWINRKARRIK